MILNKKRKILKRVLWTLAAIFALMNFVAFFHAYKFTHFSDAWVEKTKDPKKLSAVGKLSALVLGIDNPRPVNEKFPSQPYKTIRLKSNRKIECWSIKADSSKGTVILFHGYSGQKSSMLDKSNIFLKLGYSTLIVDFMGSGGSEGSQTTIGFLEGEQVKTCFDYVAAQGESKIYLFGTSMGAAAIMKSFHDYTINPAGIILECPFGSMYKTVCARFKTMNAPVFPMASLLVFWGGVQNGFWAFGHNPEEYARNINCPTLLMYGGQDDKVSRTEIDKIFSNLKSEKELKVYPLAGHENYLIQYETEWTKDVEGFLDKN